VDPAPGPQLLRRRARDGVDDNLVPRSEQLAAVGFVVYEFQMPPLPHTGLTERFYKPVLELVEALSKSSDLPIFMAGLSGGSWTTTVSTALNRASTMRTPYRAMLRVTPTAERCVELERTDNPEHEQCHPSKPYLDLYTDAGVRLLHVYNYYEGGIFAGMAGDYGYPYVNDMTAYEHTIPRALVDFMTRLQGQHGGVVDSMVTRREKLTPKQFTFPGP
jgi:hypothetical protein